MKTLYKRVGNTVKVKALAVSFVNKGIDASLFSVKLVKSIVEKVQGGDSKEVIPENKILGYIPSTENKELYNGDWNIVNFFVIGGGVYPKLGISLKLKHKEEDYIRYIKLVGVTFSGRQKKIKWIADNYALISKIGLRLAKVESKHDEYALAVVSNKNQE